jgi:hypothetical protein
MTYDYNKPRRFNVVSALLLLVALAAGYAGYKFVPVYWKARKIDQALDEIKMPATTFHRKPEEFRRTEGDKIIAKAIATLYDMGVEDEDDQPLQVWFEPDYSALNAKYKVIVTHPVGKPTVLVMERSRPIDKDQ